MDVALPASPPSDILANELRQALSCAFLVPRQRNPMGF